MTRLSQKQSEKLLAKLLSEKLKLNWKIYIPPDEFDWPDLIIEDDNDEFGLEVREYYIDECEKGSYKRSCESNHRKLIQNLAKEYYQKKRRPIKVDFLGYLNHKNKSQILDELLTINPKNWKVSESEIVFDRNSLKLFISGLPSKFENYSYWKCINDHVGVVDLNPQQKINQIVFEKASNLNKYSINLRSVSLLIFINSSYASGMLRINNQSKINKYGFSKIYVFCYPDNLYIY